MTHQFNPTILREYDIRGIVGRHADRGRRLCPRPQLCRPRSRRRRAPDRRRARRPHPLRNARSSAGARPHGRRHHVGADRPGPEPDALFRDLSSRRRRRHPGDREPQSGGLQRLQDAAQRPVCLRAGDPGARRTRSAGGHWSDGQRHDRGGRHPRSLRRPPGRRTFPERRIRIGWDAGNGARARSSICWSSACRDSISPSSPMSTAPSPTTTPTRRSRRTSPTSSSSLPTRASTSELPSTATATASARSTARAA